MNDSFWMELRSLDNKELEKVIRTAQEQMNINKYNQKMSALKKIFEGLNDLAEIGERYLTLCEGDIDGEEFSINAQDVAHYFIDEYGF